MVEKEVLMVLTRKIEADKMKFHEKFYKAHHPSFYFVDKEYQVMTDRMWICQVGNFLKKQEKWVDEKQGRFVVFYTGEKTNRLSDENVVWALSPKLGSHYGAYIRYRRIELDEVAS